MLDWPKHRNIQKFVSCENALVAENNNPAARDQDQPAFMFIVRILKLDSLELPSCALVSGPQSGAGKSGPPMMNLNHSVTNLNTIHVVRKLIFILNVQNVQHSPGGLKIIHPARAGVLVGAPSPTDP